MLKRAWLLLSTLWALFIVSGIVLKGMDPTIGSAMALAPFIVGPLLILALRFVLQGRGSA